LPYDLRWNDEKRRLLLLRLYDPLERSEAEDLFGQFFPILETPLPFFMLMDLTQFDPMKTLSRLGGLAAWMDGRPFPTVKDHLLQSRAAIVGGGALISSLFGLLAASSSTSPQALTRVFDQEDLAWRWLEEQSRAHLNPAGEVSP
jgi:hypothetical protein